MRSFSKTWTSRRKVLAGAAIAGSILASCFFMAGCQNDQEQVLAERNAAVQQQKEHDRALAQARADLERQSAEGTASSNMTSPLAASSNPQHPDMLKEEDIGLPIYPNAHLYRMPGDSGGGVKTGSGINIVLLETPDKSEPVIAFYEPRLTHTTKTTGNSGGTIVKPVRQERMDNGRKIVKLTETLENQSVRIVKISNEPDKTVIELMNILPSVPHSAVPNPTAPPASYGGTGTMQPNPTPQLNDQDDPLKPNSPPPGH